jgi:hypothetical protein
LTRKQKSKEKPKYREGRKAQNAFEQTMTALFRVSKSAPTKPKQKKGKD